MSAQQQPYQLGVDLGTTYTCAAVERGTAPSIVQLSHDSQVMPSVISLREDGAVLVGEAAERRSLTDPSRTVREFKRRFGDPAPIVIGGQALGADTLSGHLLADVLRRTEAIEGHPPSRIGLAHPASWGPFRLDLLRAAAEQAGHTDITLVPEPVAAAIANRDRVEEGALVAVYDLGGGTFDAAVVRCSGEWSVIGTPEGVERLGGIDIDQSVLSYVDAAVDGQVRSHDTSDPEVRAAMFRLLTDCRLAKEALSEDTDVEIPVQLPGLHTSVRLTRRDLEAMVRPRLGDSLAVLDRVVASAGVGWGEIASVLLVGGSSRIPAVAQMVQEHTGRPVASATNPTFAIALGTALAVTPSEVPSMPAPPPPPAIPPTAPPAAAAPPSPPPPPPAAPPAEAVPASHSSGGSPADQSSSAVPPSGRGRRGLMIGAAALVAAVAVGAGAVMFLGDDDSSTSLSNASPPPVTDRGGDPEESADPPVADDTAGPGSNSGPESDGGDGAGGSADDQPIGDGTVGDQVTGGSADGTETDGTETGSGAVGELAATRCGVDLEAEVATVAGDLVLGALDGELTAWRFDPETCRIEATAVPVEVPAPIGPVRHLSSDGVNVVAVGGDTATAVFRLRSGNVAVCDGAIGPSAPSAAGRLVSWGRGGIADGHDIGRGGCRRLVEGLEVGGTVTALVVTGETSLVAGVRRDDGSMVIVARGPSGIDWRLGDDEVVSFDSIDVITRCGAELCIVDLAGDRIHLVTSTGTLRSSAQLSAVVGDGIDELIGAGTTADGAALVASTASGTIVVLITASSS